MMSFGEGTLRKLSWWFGLLPVLGGILLLADGAHAADCGSGVEMRLSAPDAAQGSLLLVTVRSPKQLEEVAGKWNEREVPFWRAEGNTARGTSEDVRHALLGVDLQKPAGKYEFSVSAKCQAAKRSAAAR